jgi:hypothetical protein
MEALVKMIHLRRMILMQTNNYFGKWCTFFFGSFAEDDNKNPVITYCKNPKNQLDEEGNCCEAFCPKKYTKDHFGLKGE